MCSAAIPGACADLQYFALVGDKTFPILRDLVKGGVITVSEQAIISAMRLVFERMKLVIEVSQCLTCARW